MDDRMFSMPHGTSPGDNRKQVPTSQPISVTLSRIDATSILLLAFSLLACGSIGLMVVRWSNPRLKGLGWLGGGFAAGCLGVTLMMLYGLVPRICSVLLSDMLILGSFILLHVGALELSGKKSLFPKLGVGLLASQVVFFLAMTYEHPHPAMRIALIGGLVSIQVCETILLLLRGAKDRARMPMYFCATMLSGFVIVNIFRSVAVLFVHKFQRQPYSGDLVTISFVVFITVALGIAFGFFWMTTAELSAELEKMANTDPLTRIYNRRVFREWCEREIAKSRRKGSTFSLLMMDLDHFKQINDRFGHIGGDEMLIGVVEKMQDSVRGIDVLGRWGGEEFVALLPGASQDAALIVAQRVRNNIEKLLLKRPEGAPKQAGELMRLTVSVGVATYRGDTDQLEDIFQRADTALYRAKEGGRNQALWMA